MGLTPWCRRPLADRRFGNRMLFDAVVGTAAMNMFEAHLLINRILVEINPFTCHFILLIVPSVNFVLKVSNSHFLCISACVFSFFKKLILLESLAIVLAQHNHSGLAGYDLATHASLCLLLLVSLVGYDGLNSKHISNDCL